MAFFIVNPINNEELTKLPFWPSSLPCPHLLLCDSCDKKLSFANSDNKIDEKPKIPTGSIQKEKNNEENQTIDVKERCIGFGSEISQPNSYTNYVSSMFGYIFSA